MSEEIDLGPRTAGHEADYGELLSDIAAGARLHYEPGSVDPDLDLLLGDQRYARGLSRLAELGDLEATAELGDAISLIAQARATGDEGLAEAVWQAGAAAIGWGSTPALQHAKNLARAGKPEAAEALRAAAVAVAGRTR
jgi:hypothetical protein